MCGTGVGHGWTDYNKAAKVRDRVRGDPAVHGQIPLGALLQLGLEFVGADDVFQVLKQACVVGPLRHWLHHADLFHLSLREFLSVTSKLP